MAVDASKTSKLGILVVRVWDIVVCLLVSCWLRSLSCVASFLWCRARLFCKLCTGIFLDLREQIRGNHSNLRACEPRRSAE